MLGILSLLPVVGKVFDTVGTITSKITDLKVAQVKAGTDEKRDRLAAEQKALEARRDALIALAASPGGMMVVIIQSLLGFAVVIIMWKIVVWDQALQELTHGFTNKLGDDVWEYIKIVTGFYFVSTWVRR